MNRLLLGLLAGCGMLGAVLALPEAAVAQDSDTKWVRRTIRDTCLNWGYCPTRYEWVRYERPRGHRHRHPDRHYHHARYPGSGYPSSSYVDQGPLCLSHPVRERGGEYNTINGAKIDAVRRWQASVRADFGERYMDIATARSIVYDCHRSSSNESWQGKAAAFAGRVLEKLTGDEEDAYKKRCVVVATPCREPLRSVSADGKPVDDNRSTKDMIRELERQGYKVTNAATPGHYQPKKRWYYRYVGRERQ